jgi:hypothetical protein
LDKNKVTVCSSSSAVQLTVNVGGVAQEAAAAQYLKTRNSRRRSSFHVSAGLAAAAAVETAMGLTSESPHRAELVAGAVMTALFNLEVVDKSIAEEERLADRLCQSLGLHTESARRQRTPRMTAIQPFVLDRMEEETVPQAPGSAGAGASLGQMGEKRRALTRKDEVGRIALGNYPAHMH